MGNFSSRPYLTEIETLRHLKVSEEDLNYLLLQRRIRKAIHPLELAVEYSHKGHELFLSNDLAALYFLRPFSDEAAKSGLFVDIPEFLYFYASDVKSTENYQNGNIQTVSYISKFETFDGTSSSIITIYGDTYRPIDLYPSRPAVYTLEELNKFMGSSDAVHYTDETTPAPTAKRKANTRLKIIAALCNELKIDRNARGAATAIQRATEMQGNPISEETVRNVLKEIADLLGENPN